MEHLRGRTEVVEAVRRLVRSGAEVVTTEPVAMELLAGAGPANLDRVDRLVRGLPSIAVEPWLDFRGAADLYRRGRLSGQTPRNLMDCLIAAIAVRAGGVVLVHRDAGYERLATVSALRQIRWP